MPVRNKYWSKMLGFLLGFKGAIFLIILLYFLLAMFNIDCPGLNTDEAFNGVVSNNILKDVSDIAKGKTQFLSYHVVLFRKIFPITAAQYYGPVIPYLILPLIRILGPNSISLRLNSIFILAIFLLFVYKLCKIWFGERVGLLAALLTATNLVFVQYSRVGLFRCEIFVMVFFWVGLFFLIRYSQSKKNLLLCLGFLFFGLAFSTKITFLYYAVGLTLAYFVIGRKINLLGPFNIKKIIIILLSFCLGAFFVITYNIMMPWVNVKQLFFALTDPNATKEYTVGMAVNNWDYLYNLKLRLLDLFTLLKGDISSRIDWGVINTSIAETISPLITSLTIISLILVLFLALFLSKLPEIIKKRILFIYIIYFSVFFLSPFSLSGFNQGHLLILLPFPQVAMAIFLGYILDTAEQKSKLIIKIFTRSLIAITILFGIWMNIYFNIQMKKTGGYGRWSTAISELVDYLQKNKIFSPVMFGYGLHANLMFLTDNKVAPVIYDKFYPQPFPSAYKQLFSNKEPLFYLTLEPEMNELTDYFMSKNFPGEKINLDRNLRKILFMRFSGDESIFYRDLFMKFIKEYGKSKRLEKVFLNRSGYPVYWLYKIY